MLKAVANAGGDISGVSVTAPITGGGSSGAVTIGADVPFVGTYGGTGVNNGTKTITLGGNLTTSGAFNSTFTMTGATGLTFPTTGTLATLAGSEAFTNKTYNGNSWTAGTGTLTIAASKTLTCSNILTLAGTDSTTMTFPALSSTVLTTGNTATLTKGYSNTPTDQGTKSSGTFTPDEANGFMQYCVNGGAFTLAPPANNTMICIQITNNGSAGAITTSGFTKVAGAFTTTNGDDFFAYITRNNGFTFLNIQALQ